MFSFNWFKKDNKEREDLKRLREEKEALEEKVARYENTSKTSNDLFNNLLQKKAYSRILYSGDIITVILQDGTPLSVAGVVVDIVDAVKACKTEEEIKAVLYPKPVEEYKPVESSPITTGDLDILRDKQDFIVENGKAYLKNVGLELPPIVLASFIEISEKIERQLEESNDGYNSLPTIGELEEQYDALKMFWYWTALNPIESSRNDLLSFVKKNDVKITSNGLLEMYRKVVTVGSGDKPLTKFVSEQYFRIKKMKKGTANYEVWKGFEDGDGFTLTKVGHKVADEYKTYELVGNLQQLYIDLPTLEENTYTDGHTRTKSIKIGEIYQEDEDKIDLNNRRNCSSGLHCGSHTFLFDGFGDTGVLVLVNPMKVRSVPVSETNKMRVSEMFICSTLDLQDYKDHVLSGDINDYSEQYYNTSLEELERSLEEKSFGGLVCQENAPAVTIGNILDIKELLKSRIKQVV